MYCLGCAFVIDHRFGLHFDSNSTEVVYERCFTNHSVSRLMMPDDDQAFFTCRLSLVEDVESLTLLKVIDGAYVMP